VINLRLMDVSQGPVIAVGGCCSSTMFSFGLTPLFLEGSLFRLFSIRAYSTPISVYEEVGIVIVGVFSVHELESAAASRER